MTEASLNAAEIARLDALADALIPADDESLSASGAGVFGALLPGALSYAPEIVPLCQQVLAAVPEGVEVWTLRLTDGALFERFAEIVAAIYFMSPEVRSAVGFPGRAAVPARTDPDAFAELLMPVLEGDFEPRPV